MKWLVTAALLLFLLELGVAHKLSADTSSHETEQGSVHAVSPSSQAPDAAQK